MKTIAAALLILSACCGAAAAQAPPRSEAPHWVEEFTLFYERRGGLAAESRRLVVRSERRATVKWTIRRSLRTARFRLSPLTVKRLHNALATPQWRELRDPGPSGCADCYVHSISWDGHAVTLDDSELPVWLRRTVRRLESLVGAHRPRH